ncbi:hypothetical protein V8E53_007333 [Lactarius tabidus]
MHINNIDAVNQVNIHCVQPHNDLTPEVPPSHVSGGYEGTFGVALIDVNIEQPNFQCIRDPLGSELACTCECYWWAVDHQDVGKGQGWEQGGNGHIPMGLCYHVGQRQDDTDHHEDQGVHKEMAALMEGRRADPVFGRGAVNNGIWFRKPAASVGGNVGDIECPATSKQLFAVPLSREQTLLALASASALSNLSATSVSSMCMMTQAVHHLTHP